MFKKITKKMNEMAINAYLTLTDRKGEGFMEPGIMIAILAVIGGLFMTSLYGLFEDTIMPTVTTTITDIFGKVPTIS